MGPIASALQRRTGRHASSRTLGKISASVARRAGLEEGRHSGVPGYPPIAMFKISFLRQWYGLSDPAAEEALADRLSFRRFCGFRLDQKTPDHMSIWRFRRRLVDLGLQDQLLAELNRQLDGRGLLATRATSIGPNWLPITAELRHGVHKPIPDWSCRARFNLAATCSWAQWSFPVPHRSMPRHAEWSTRRLLFAYWASDAIPFG